MDGMTPMEQTQPSSARKRLVYCPGELAHFDVGSSRFALVPLDFDQGEQAARRPPPTKDVRELLSAREIQIVHLICLGLLTKQVADRLGLSEFTVRSYLKTIYCKLGVHSRGGLAFAYAKAFGVQTGPCEGDP